MIRHVLFVLAASSIAGCNGAQAPPPAEPLTMADARAGQRIAEAHCSTCHAIGTEGASPHQTAPPFRTLSQNYPISALEEAFAEGIMVGHPDMPEFRLEPGEIDALIAYIHTVQGYRTE